jgi:phospholipid transport system substrate-binding protein
MPTRLLARRGLLVTPLVALAATPRAGAAQSAGTVLSAVVAPVQRLVESLLQIMRMGRSIPFERRFETFAPVVDQVFNLEAILRASVGSIWNTLPADQQDLLRGAFRRYTVASYVNSFDSLNGQRFTVSPEPRPVGNNDMIVQTRIIPASGNGHSLDYVMRQSDGGWKVVDVLAEGAISRVAVQRSDFRQLLNRGGVTALATSLRQKFADLSNG